MIGAAAVLACLAAGPNLDQVDPVTPKAMVVGPMIFVKLDLGPPRRNMLTPSNTREPNGKDSEK